ncbi:MAG: EH signature domain-containing protein [Oceanicaulis sp.]
MGDETRLSKAIGALNARVDGVDGAALEDPTGFVGRLIDVWERERDFSTLKRREVRAAARHVFSHDAQGRRIADDAKRLTGLLAHPGATGSAQAIKNFATAFLAGFDNSRLEAMEILANHINSAAAERRLETVDAWIGAGLIDARKGAQKLTARVLAGGGAVAGAFEALRIPEMIRGEGLSRAAYGHACAYVRAHGAESSLLIDTLIDWATQSGDADEGRIQARFPDKVGETVNALLLPWRSGAPDKDVERKVRNFVIAAVGDPRFAGSSAQWADVDEAARQVLTGWLTRASVVQFFDIVSQTMRMPDEKRMWRYRRKFWSAYLPHITNAWVAFGAQGEHLARETARRTEDNSFKQFGRLHGSSQSTHAVLIITIGDLVIAEWSHSGMCRMWPRGHARAPKLYDPNYQAFALRWGEWWEERHHGNETYGWQRKFADKIRLETGVSVSAAEYKVR